MKRKEEDNRHPAKQTKNRKRDNGKKKSKNQTKEEAIFDIN